MTRFQQLMLGRNEPPPIVEWFRYRIFGLFILALFAIRFGITYTPLLDRQVRPLPPLEFITALIAVPFPANAHWQPIYLLGGIWCCVGILALCAMVTDKLHNAAFISGAAFTLYWAGAYYASQISDQASPDGNDFLAGVYLTVGALFIIHAGLTTRPGKGGDTADDITDDDVGLPGGHGV